MNEKLFQFIWRYQLFNATQLVTTDHQPILIINPGTWNQHAGPDFLEAKIKIDQTYWIGHIELHLKSSDWIKHDHQTDPRYSNIILHVVLVDDQPIERLSDHYFPTVQLHNRMNYDLLRTYEGLMQQQHQLPCHAFLDGIKPILLHQWLERVLIERIEHKVQVIQQRLEKSESHWQYILYHQLARCFGLMINQDEFEELAHQVPFKLILKHRSSREQLEALLFGQAGFLTEYFSNPYPIQLQNHYGHMARLYQLQAMDSSRWKFLRLRPSSFPTLRIAQFAQFLFDHAANLFDLIHCNDLKQLEALFKIEVHGFWEKHYTLHHESEERNKQTGKMFFLGILLNAIIPIKFLYGKLQGQEHHSDAAVNWLYALPFEQNHITLFYKSIGFPHAHAGHSQSLLQLKKNYCDPRRCLDCGIGFQILKDPTRAKTDIQEHQNTTL